MSNDWLRGLFGIDALVVTKSNPNHEPAGSPQGGQFAPAPGGDKQPSQMTHEERQAEIERIKTDFRDILATPLMSEGAISPAQVGMMSERQRKKYSDNAQQRMKLETRIRDLSQTDEQLHSAHSAEELKNAAGMIQYHQYHIRDWTQFGKGAGGKIRPKYQREIDKANAEIEKIYAAYPSLRKS